MSRTIPVRLYRTAVLLTIAAPMLLTAGCGSNDSPSALGKQTSQGTSKSEGPAAENGSSARETAETRLQKIDTSLNTVLTNYRSGQKDQAYNLAKSTTDLYEGTTEGIATRMCAADNRQLDPLLMATLPNAIKSNHSTSEIGRLVQQAQNLARHCLDTIHHNE